MRKIFLSICFSMIGFSAMAGVRALSSPEEIKVLESAPRPPSATSSEVEIPEGMSPIEYLKERLEKSIITKISKEEALNASSMDMQRSAEYIAQQQEDSKSTFQKIYESALERVSAKPQQPEDISPPKGKMRQEEREVFEKPQFDVVNIELPPFGEKILAPAQEHIPFLFSDIKISPSGLIEVEETVVVVANGEKLKNGLSRSIPKYSTSRIGDRHKIDLSLISVELNGHEVPYRLQETNDAILIVPAFTHTLDPGVYNYRIKYAVDRHLWYYDDFDEFYWDVTGSSWNLVIVRAGATLTLPNSAEPLGYTLFMGYSDELSNFATATPKAENGVVSFISQRPLFNGEGMHIIASLPKQIFELPSLEKRWLWFVSDYGAVLFSAMGFMAIFISYVMSWHGINRKNIKQKGGIKRTAMMMRYLARNVFDKISFGAFLLELFKKNIIDIQQSDGKIILVKKSDFLSPLSKLEKKAMGEMFINRESVLNIDGNNAIKIKRAYKLIEEDTVKRFKSFTRKLNLGYLFFSVGMLLCAEIFIALVSVDKVQMISLLISYSAIFAFYIWLWGKRTNTGGLNFLIKFMLTLMIILTLITLGVFVNVFAAIIILATIWTIFSYTKLFSKRSGLIKNNIKEAVEYEDFLLNNRGNLNSARDFSIQQPNIFALDLAKEFPVRDTTKDVYRLDVVENLVKKL